MRSASILGPTSMHRSASVQALRILITCMCHSCAASTQSRRGTASSLRGLPTPPRGRLVCLPHSLLGRARVALPVKFKGPVAGPDRLSGSAPACMRCDLPPRRVLQARGSTAPRGRCAFRSTPTHPAVPVRARGPLLLQLQLVATPPAAGAQHGAKRQQRVSVGGADHGTQLRHRLTLERGSRGRGGGSGEGGRGGLTDIRSNSSPPFPPPLSPARACGRSGPGAHETPLDPLPRWGCFAPGGRGGRRLPRHAALPPTTVSAKACDGRGFVHGLIRPSPRPVRTPPVVARDHLARSQAPAAVSPDCRWAKQDGAMFDVRTLGPCESFAWGRAIALF